MSRPYFRILCSKYDLENYLDHMGCEYHPNWLHDAEHSWNFDTTAEEVEDLADFVLTHAMQSKLQRIAEDYGVVSEEQTYYENMLMHIADEILGNCCRILWERS